MGSTDEKDQGTSSCPAFKPHMAKANSCTECMKLLSSHRKEAVEEKYIASAIEYDQKNLNVPSVVLPREGDGKIGALLLGGFHTVMSLKEKSKQVTHVVNTARGLQIFGLYTEAVTSLKEAGIKFLNLDWDDSETQDIDKDLKRALEFIEEGRLQGGDVLVHCAQGKSRSATVVVAYIMAKSSLYSTVATALKYTQEKRKMAEPNPGFMRKLNLWQESANFRSLRGSASSSS